MTIFEMFEIIYDLILHFLSYHCVQIGYVESKASEEVRYCKHNENPIIHQVRVRFAAGRFINGALHFTDLFLNLNITVDRYVVYRNGLEESTQGRTKDNNSAHDDDSILPAIVINELVDQRCHEEGAHTRTADGDPGGKGTLLLKVHGDADDGRQVHEAKTQALCNGLILTYGWGFN